MDKYINENESQGYKQNPLDILSAELNDIQLNNKLILKKSMKLSEQIISCESKQKYIHAALTESKKIAQEITNNATQRVENIMATAYRVIDPQQEQIASIEEEIAYLSREIDSKRLVEKKPQPQVINRKIIRHESQQKQQERIKPREQSEIIDLDQHKSFTNLREIVYNRENNKSFKGMLGNIFKGKD